MFVGTAAIAVGRVDLSVPVTLQLGLFLSFGLLLEVHDGLIVPGFVRKGRTDPLAQGPLCLTDRLGLDIFRRVEIFVVLGELGLGATRNVVDVLEVSAQVSALREGLLAESAGEGSLACVLAEVVSEVAALFENTVAAWILAFEEQLDAVSLLVLHLDSLVPLSRDSCEGLRGEKRV